MTGPQISHVQIVKSTDQQWMNCMLKQCEIGAYWIDGENHGITYEVVEAEAVIV